MSMSTLAKASLSLSLCDYNLLMVVVMNVLQFDFSGRRDLVRFIKEIQAQGLYVCLRMGPFIEAEWSYG